MVYLLKKNFSPVIRVRIALNKIYGLGEFFSNQLCDQLGINSNFKMNQLKRNQIDKINRIVASYYITGYELHKKSNIDIKRQISIGSYKGFRHVNKLPVRGQRTKTNSRTARKCN